MSPRPESKHEFAVTRILSSWWRFAGALWLATVPAVAAGYVLFTRRELWRSVPLLLLFSAVLFGMAVLSRRSTSWSLTSERLIERRGILARRRRELELADIRSVEVDRRFMQRIIGLGDVTVASAASTDFSIRLQDVPAPETIAETLRQARLKRLA